MVVLLIDISISVRSRKRAVIQPTHNPDGGNKGHYHQRGLQRQMFILMTTSIFIFLITTLPVSIYKITSPRQADLSTALLTIIVVWTGLGWLQSLNYAVDIFVFYNLYFFTFPIAKFLQSLSYFNIISQRIQTTNQIFMWE